jgi:hypothetical protein
LFVFFEFAFVSMAFLMAEPILGVLAWSAVLAGNLLAAVGMAGYLFFRHRNLRIFP